MSKGLIVFLVIGILLVALGVVVALTAGWDYRVADDGYEIVASCEPDQVTAVRAETGAAEIRVYETSGDKIEVAVGGLPVSRIDAAVENGVLTLRETKASFLDTLLRRRGYVVVWLPADSVSEVRAAASSGDVALSGLRAPEMTAVLSSSSGTVSVYDTEAASLTLETSSGGVYTGNVRLSGDVRATVSSGTTALHGVRCGRVEISGSSGGVSLRDVIGSEVKAETSSGIVQIDDVRADSVSATTSSGSVDAWKLDAAAVEIETVSGSVELELEGSAEDYAADVSSRSGSVRGIVSCTGGERSVRISTVSGRISVNFTE